MPAVQLQRVHPPAVLRRLGGALLLLWLVLTITFALIRLAPGDAAAFLVPPSASAADVARIRAELGLDQSIVVQYARWGAALLRGDLGESFSLHQPVARALAQALPVSLGLGVASLALTFLIGVPIGMVQAVRRGTAARSTCSPCSRRSCTRRRASGSRSRSSRVFTYGAAAWGLPAVDATAGVRRCDRRARRCTASPQWWTSSGIRSCP